MVRRAGIFVLMSVFLAFPLFAQAPSEPKQDFGRKVNKDRIESRLQELTKKLNLTSEQKAKVREILISSREEAVKTLEEAKRKTREIREKADENIRILLTEEQKKKFQKKSRGN